MRPEPPPPVVRYMLVSDDLWTHPVRPNSPIIVGLINVITSPQ
jgi:hypothetical protein